MREHDLAAVPVAEELDDVDAVALGGSAVAAGAAALALDNPLPRPRVGAGGAAEDRAAEL